MADIYDMLLTGDVGDQGRMEAMARKLRQREALGTLGALSGDPVLGPWGTGEVGRARESAAGLGEARRQAMTPQMTGTPGWFREGGEFKMFPGYRAQQEQAFQRKMDLEAAKSANRAAAAEEARRQRMTDAMELERWKRTQPTATQTGVARETLAYLPELQTLATQLSSGDFEIPALPETAASVMRDFPVGGEAMAAATERMGMSPAAVDWLARGRQMEQELMRLASGLAVTQAEMQALKKYSPWALNLTPRERLQRLSNVYNKLGRKAATIQGQPWGDVSFTEKTQRPDQSGTDVSQAGAPVVGFIHTDEDGTQRRFKGGDPNNQNNWESLP